MHGRSPDLVAFRVQHCSEHPQWWHHYLLGHYCLRLRILHAQHDPPWNSTGVIATLWAWMMAWPAGRLKNARCLIIAGANCVTFVCSVLMWKLPRSNQHGLLAAYYVFYTYWGPYCMAQTLYMSNTSGHSKKVSMGAVYFVGYCVGNVRTWPPERAPSQSIPDFVANNVIKTDYRTASIPG